MKLRAALLAAAFTLPCAAVALPCAAIAQTVDTIDPILKTKIDRIAHGVMEQHGVPSVSIAVLQHGHLVFTHAYGLAHLHPDIPATPEMRYAIGSISKQFTAAAILILQEQGKLKLDDPVGKYIPGLTRGNEITIRQILSHTSGYQDYWPEDYLMIPMMKPATAQYIVDTWAKKPLDFEPGTQWQYSNTNYVIAGLIIEKVSGQKVFEFIGQHIFHPLGMKSVYNYDESGLTATDAAPYIRSALGPLRPAPKEGSGWMFAAGEIAMTPHDLALWNESLIAQSLLKPESYKEMFTSIKLTDGKDSHYGLGVFIRNYNGHRVIEHSGEVTGFVAESLILPDDGVSAIALTNHMASGAGQVGQLVADAVLGATSQKPAEKQALEIFRGLQKGEIDRTLLAPNLSGFFDAQAIEDYKTSLAPLGEPLSLTQTGEEQRGGMTGRDFRITYPTKHLTLSTYTYPDGKLEQYLIYPAD